MDELGFDFNSAVSWFQHQQDNPYILIKLKATHLTELSQTAILAIRRCYISDDLLNSRAANLQRPKTDILASRLPDPGSTMAGDFGEILCYFYQSTKELPSFAIGAKKWRLKQDRTKPAPLSDVVQFLMPDRPDSSKNDAVLCTEVKVKSTNGSSTPIASAINDCQKDQTSRLAASLVWLRARAMTEDLGDVDIPLLERFINLTDHPPVSKRFRAMAVICDSLLQSELKEEPNISSSDFTLVVIAVPNLKQTYQDIFSLTRASAEVRP